MDELLRLLGGVNPTVEIPNLWFEIIKTQMVLEELISELGKQIPIEILNRAHQVAFERLNTRFPALGLKLNMPKDPVTTLTKSEEVPAETPIEQTKPEENTCTVPKVEEKQESKITPITASWNKK